MSGNAVQRGEFSIADKYIRAEALLKCGADLVIELPFPWSSASAEYFASAGVSIINNFCDTLIFGSESGNIEMLSNVAEAVSSEKFTSEYNTRISTGERSAALYYEMIKEKTNNELSSNDILGVEHIKAARKLNLTMNFETIPRQGDRYLCETVNDRLYPSATAIRKLWMEGKFDETKQYIPDDAVDIYENAMLSGDIVDQERIDDLMISFFRLNDGKTFSHIAGSGGIENRICSMAKKAHNLNKLMELTKNKRYTDSHIRRVMLYCMAGVMKEDLESVPKEALLLATNSKGTELLSAVRKKQNIKIITKPADLDMKLRQNILNNRLENLYSMVFNPKKESESYLKKKPYISK
jgi:predicted nucleotidyltransferase